MTPPFRGSKSFPKPLRLGLLADASATKVEEAFRRCRGRLPTEWIDPSSKYRSNSQRALSRQIGSRNSDATADFAAAGALLHCVDAWSYLGNALGALTHGSLNQAIHFAYYGELHAAQSFLACHGILIANSISAVIDDKGVVRQAHDQGTHQATWELLVDWATLSTSPTVIGELVTYNGFTLNGWLDRKSPAAKLSGGLSELVGQWGIDLAHYAADRRRRNLVSYHPSNLALVQRPDYYKWVGSALDETWSLIEPASQGTFPQIDQFLVRNSMERIHQGQWGRWNAQPGNKSLERWDRDIERMFANSTESAATYLTRASRPADPSMLRAALSSPPPSTAPSPLETLGVLGRALILLRLCTGTVDTMRDRAGLRPEDLRVWSTFTGEELGYWRPGDAPDPLTGLWDDGNTAGAALADAIDDGRVTGMADLPTIGRDLWTAGTTTRAALWSLSA